MYQFFVEDEQVQQDRICIVGGDVNHIGHVLRMKTGEKIRTSDHEKSKAEVQSNHCRPAGV